MKKLRISFVGAFPVFFLACVELFAFNDFRPVFSRTNQFAGERIPFPFRFHTVFLSLIFDGKHLNPENPAKQDPIKARVSDGALKNPSTPVFSAPAFVIKTRDGKRLRPERPTPRPNRSSNGRVSWLYRRWCSSKRRPHCRPTAKEPPAGSMQYAGAQRG